jgi:hypothetical protein
MGCIGKGAAQSRSAELDQKTQEKRLRIAERIVQALRQAGYSCELGDDGPARALVRED